VLSNNTRLHIAMAANSNSTARYRLPCAADAVDRVPSSVSPDDVIPRNEAFPAVTSSTTVSGQYAAMFSTRDAGPTLPNTVRPYVLHLHLIMRLSHRPYYAPCLSVLYVSFSARLSVYLSGTGAQLKKKQKNQS